MTTKKQLVEWLAQFDDDTVVKIVSASKYQASWYETWSVYAEDFVIPTIDISTVRWLQDQVQDTVEFVDLDYNYAELNSTKIKTILLGRIDA